MTYPQPPTVPPPPPVSRPESGSGGGEAVEATRSDSKSPGRSPSMGGGHFEPANSSDLRGYDSVTALQAASIAAAASYDMYGGQQQAQQQPPSVTSQPPNSHPQVSTDGKMVGNNPASFYPWMKNYHGKSFL